jgi:hypothetical protein
MDCKIGVTPLYFAFPDMSKAYVRVSRVCGKQDFTLSVFLFHHLMNCGWVSTKTKLNVNILMMSYGSCDGCLKFLAS